MPARYRLSRTAEADLFAIHVSGVRDFGSRQADDYLAELFSVFELIAESPEMARLRTELRRPVRVHPHRSHMITYVEDADGVLILRVLPARYDWQNDL